MAKGYRGRGTLVLRCGVGDGRMMQFSRLGHSRASQTIRAGCLAPQPRREEVDRDPRFPGIEYSGPGPRC